MAAELVISTMSAGAYSCWVVSWRYLLWDAVHPPTLQVQSVLRQDWVECVQSRHLEQALALETAAFLWARVYFMKVGQSLRREAGMV